ncbi:F-box protein At5g49610-like isoform X3 [Ananas comosus]|uniref:F-box protein At5g49610-like isoform X3 n=1 Tax=Ananas comosus TaxID=4615 RepID=A0A6P5EC03_ANACO|nr:F-box protein At5g49610-like isoform X3 [Ananas comosus]
MNPRDSHPVSLPIDLTIQILARLPTKSLLRFRSVCKLWREVLSQKQFVDLHFALSSRTRGVAIESPDHAASTPDLVCVDPILGVSAFSLDFLDDRVKIRASCNGLLCCSSVRSRGVYYVCNPMTREFRVLPRTRERPFTRSEPEYEATLVGLGFDPATWRIHVAIAGFHRSFGRWPRGGDRRLVCKVFDAATGAWTRFAASMCDEFTCMNRNQSVYAGCSMNWLTHCCRYVSVLDLENMLWGKITLPDEVLATQQGTRFYLLELEGSVSVVQMSRFWMSTWVLKDRAKEEWALVDRVNLRCIDGYAASVFPISQTKDVVFMATQKKILMHDRNSRVWKEVYGVEGNFTYPLWFSAFAFGSTLFPCRQAIFHMHSVRRARRSFFLLAHKSAGRRESHLRSSYKKRGPTFGRSESSIECCLPKKLGQM